MIFRWVGPTTTCKMGLVISRGPTTQQGWKNPLLRIIPFSKWWSDHPHFKTIYKLFFFEGSHTFLRHLLTMVPWWFSRTYKSWDDIPSSPCIFSPFRGATHVTPEESLRWIGGCHRPCDRLQWILFCRPRWGGSLEGGRWWWWWWWWWWWFRWFICVYDKRFIYNMYGFCVIFSKNRVQKKNAGFYIYILRFLVKHVYRLFHNWLVSVTYASCDLNEKIPDRQGCGLLAHYSLIHQEFQVPKMEVLNLIFGYFGGGFSVT